ncbi:MAG: GtrA family protein, partial [Deferribacteres bacterium]|nr:GtrA family protein [Deferribacteres bacterium]
MKAVKDTYISEHLVKYLAIGIVNTIVGYSV